MFQNGTEYISDNVQSAVTLQFYDVFSGIAFRCFEYKGDGIVYFFSVIVHMTEMRRISVRINQHCFIGSGENSIRDFTRIFSGYSDDSDAAGSLGRRNGCNCFTHTFIPFYAYYLATIISYNSAIAIDL